MEVTGKVIHAMEPRSGVSSKTGNPWTTREYVLEVPNDQFSPRHLVFSVFGEEKLRQFGLRKDEVVTVYFDIDAHEYQGKWFNRITAYNITRPVVQPQSMPQPQVAVQTPQPQTAPQQTMYVAPAPQPQSGGDDVLPF